jgi:hypothetical protein
LVFCSQSNVADILLPAANKVNHLPQVSPRQPAAWPIYSSAPARRLQRLFHRLRYLVLHYFFLWGKPSMRCSIRALLVQKGLVPALITALSLVLQISSASAADDAKASSDALPTVRIRAGSVTPYKDSQGNQWLPDTMTKDGGFDGGETIDRPDDLQVKNTKDPALYRSEHYSMDSFSWKLPNGKYIVKLHFAETYDGIGGAGDRVFSFKVQDKLFKDFDIWKKAGGTQTVYIEKVPVDITDGKLKVTFIPDIQNPCINGIEIIPADKAAAEDKPTEEKAAAK